jgi:hypothetical protein
MAEEKPVETLIKIGYRISMPGQRPEGILQTTPFRSLIRHTPDWQTLKNDTACQYKCLMADSKNKDTSGGQGALLKNRPLDPHKTFILLEWVQAKMYYSGTEAPTILNTK